MAKRKFLPLTPLNNEQGTRNFERRSVAVQHSLFLVRYSILFRRSRSVQGMTRSCSCVFFIFNRQYPIYDHIFETGRVCMGMIVRGKILHFVFIKYKNVGCIAFTQQATVMQLEFLC